MAAPAVFRAGDDVEVFYRMSKRCEEERKYLAMIDPRQGSYRPRVGMSDGWVPARVVGDEEQRSGAVRIAYRWPYFFTHRGHMTNHASGWTEWYDVEDIRKGEATPAGARLTLCGAQHPPELAILTFRWGGLNAIVAPEQWGETGSSVSDIFVDSFIDMAVMPHLNRNFEVWTVYIEDQTDLAKIADTCNLIFGPNHPCRRAKRTVAFYHLYPTGFEEHCVPNCETGEDMGAALVDQKSLFRLIKAVEKCGIPTRFPHPSGFYELLTSKRWTYQMSLVPHLRVPPSVSVPRMLIEENYKTAAAFALDSLCEVKRQQALLRNEPEPTDRIVKGVAKLGFSWEALDVKFWEGQDGLEASLAELTQSIEISGEMTGQPHDLEALIVQEYVPHDFELRLYAVEGEPEVIIFTKFCRIKDNNEFGDFKELFDRKEAAQQWMEGDMEAMADAERQCREISAHWLAWARAQLCEVPPAIRFDYFVGRSAKGKAFAWTLEICELGFSMLGSKALPKKVFDAMLRSCLGGGAANAGQQLSNGTDAASASRESRNGVTTTQNSTSAPKTTTEVEKSKGSAPKDGAAGHEDSADYVNITVPKHPKGTPDQVNCSGVYKRVEGLSKQGMPVYCGVGGTRWLFVGLDGYWYVGDEEEEQAEFDVSQGYIRHKSAPGVLPTSLAGPWERGDTWFVDRTIEVSAMSADAASADRTTESRGKGGKSKHKGKR